MNHSHPPHPAYKMYALGTLLGLIILGTGYALWHQYRQITTLTTDRDTLTFQLASTTDTLATLETAHTMLETQMIQTQNSLANTKQALIAEQNRNQDFEDQIKSLAGTVGVLDKVSKTDPELLQKYSKVYFLNENYIPASIKQIDTQYVLKGKGDQYFEGDALPFLTDMIDAADKDGVILKIDSAYRSFETQSDLKGAYTQTYGSGANTFSADQGYSEHQLGTAVDLTDTEVAGTYLSFKDTEAYAWLQKNAYEYGFVLSYPEGNDYYVFEPWHWRFVGVKLATDLHRDKANFYDWDQRKIDGYLVSIFD